MFLAIGIEYNTSAVTDNNKIIAIFRRLDMNSLPEITAVVVGRIQQLYAIVYSVAVRRGNGKELLLNVGHQVNRLISKR